MKFLKISIITAIIFYLLYSFSHYDLLWIKHLDTWTIKERVGMIFVFFFKTFIDLIIKVVHDDDFI